MVWLDWTILETIDGILVRKVTCVYDSSAVLWNQKMTHWITEWQCHLLSCLGELKTGHISVFRPRSVLHTWIYGAHQWAHCSGVTDLLPFCSSSSFVERHIFCSPQSIIVPTIVIVWTLCPGNGGSKWTWTCVYCLSRGCHTATHAPGWSVFSSMP